MSLVAIPGVKGLVTGTVANISVLVTAAGIAGVVTAVNAIMLKAGTAVNGIPSGTLPDSLVGIMTLLPIKGINVANAISLANGGGMRRPRTPSLPL